MDPLDIALAALPIVAIIGMLALRTPPIRAVLIAILGTLALSFRFPLAPDHIVEVAGSLAGVGLAVVLIIFGGIILSEFLTASGAQDRISDWLGHATYSRERAILLLGLGVAPLAESVIGWGVGVIVGVPLLMRVGLSTTKACSIGLLGLVLAPWGSLGASMLVIKEMSGLPLRDIGLWTAAMNLPVQIVMAGAIGIIGLGIRTTLRMSGEILVVTLLMWTTLISFNSWVSTSLSGIFASLVGIFCFLAFARLQGGPLPVMDRDTVRALTPYSVLIGSLLIITAVATVADLGEWEGILTSPALWLMVTAAITPALLRIPRATVPPSVRAGVILWWPVCLITILFIAFGALLATNGMSDTLASGAAQLGLGFLLLMPVIGFLAGYVTASSTATAAMVTVGISEATAALGANPLTTLGAQNVATGSAVMTSPSRVALAISVADGLRADGAEKADPVRIMLAVLSANAVMVVLLAPLTLLLAFTTSLPLP